MTPVVGDALIDPKFVERVKYLRSQAQIGDIWITTNGILLDKHGLEEVLNSGLTYIAISMAGFDEDMYRRVYRCDSYQRVRRNVMELLRLNSARAKPIPIGIALRPDRPEEEVRRSPDFRTVLTYKPQIHFEYFFTSASGRVTPQALPEVMKLLPNSSRNEACAFLFIGPVVCPDGTVMACPCVAATDAVADLRIGHVLESSLLDIWTDQRLRQLRSSFGTASLNRTCATCGLYRNLDLYRTAHGRKMARLNRERYMRKIIAG